MQYTVNMRDECGSDNTVSIDAESVAEAWGLAETETEEWCRGGDWGTDGASVACYYSLELYTADDLTELDAAIDRLTNICPDAYDGLSIAEIESGEIDTDGLPPALIAVAEALHTARAEMIEAIESLGDERRVSVEIEPDHSSLIAAAAGHTWDEGGKTIRGCGAEPDDHDWTSEGEGGCTENPGVWSTGGTSMVFRSHCRKCGLQRVEHSTGSQRNPGEHDTTEYTMPDSWCAVCEREECRHPVEDGCVNYTDCDDDQPGGDEVNGYATESLAREVAVEVAHERSIRAPDKVIVAYDDTDGGDGEYHVYVVE